MKDMEYKRVTFINKKEKSFCISTDFICGEFKNTKMSDDDFLIFARNIDEILDQIIKNGENLGLKNRNRKQHVLIVCLYVLQRHLIEIKDFEVFTRWLSKTYIDYLHEYEDYLLKNNKDTWQAFSMAQFSTRKKLETILEN